RRLWRPAPTLSDASAVVSALPFSAYDRSELTLFQPKDIGAATVEGIGQRERDAASGPFRLRVLRRRRGVRQAQHRRVLVGVQTLEDEDRAVRHPGVGDQRFGVVDGIEKEWTKLVGGGDEIVGVRQRI